MAAGSRPRLRKERLVRSEDTSPELLETMQALVEHDEIDGALRQPRLEVKDVLPDLLQSSQKMIRAASWPWRSTLMTFCLSGGPGDPAGI